MESLPVEIILRILSKVSIMELFVLKCVCRSWNKMIKDNQSELIQLRRASPSLNDLLLIMRDDRDPGDMFCTYLAPRKGKRKGYRQKVLVSKNVMGCSFKIVGSCNGLLCLVDGETKSRFVVINPLTNQSVRLPKLDLKPCSVLSYGFGYDSNTNSYKVIVIIRNWAHVDESGVLIFDCKTHNNWRSLERRHQFFGNTGSINPPIFLDGRLHWVIHREIVSFDLINEKFTSIQMPGHLSIWWVLDLIVFKGCLCVVDKMPSPATKRSKMYMRMEMYRVEPSWENIVSCCQLINYPCRPMNNPEGRVCLQALGEVENGKILMKTGKTMVLFDTVSKECKSLGYQYRKLPSGCSVIHFPTLDLEWPRLSL